MSKSYEDYERDYESLLARIRSFLASTRSNSTLSECERLLQEARKCATAMQGLAEVEGDFHKVEISKQRLQQDLKPIQGEIDRYKNASTSASNTEDLFYRPPNLEEEGGGQAGLSTDMESLLHSSEHLLRESQAICADTEEIGMTTLTQMEQQREQLQIAGEDLDETTNMMMQARVLLKKMRYKVLRNKLVLQFLIFVLILANVYVLYLIGKKHSHK